MKGPLAIHDNMARNDPAMLRVLLADRPSGTVQGLKELVVSLSQPIESLSNPLLKSSSSGLSG